MIIFTSHHPYYTCYRPRKCLYRQHQESSIKKDIKKTLNWAELNFSPHKGSVRYAAIFHPQGQGVFITLSSFRTRMFVWKGEGKKKRQGKERGGICSWLERTRFEWHDRYSTFFLDLGVNRKTASAERREAAWHWKENKKDTGVLRHRDMKWGNICHFLHIFVCSSDHTRDVASSVQCSASDHTGKFFLYAIHKRFHENLVLSSQQDIHQHHRAWKVYIFNHNISMFAYEESVLLDLWIEIHRLLRSI